MKPPIVSVIMPVYNTAKYVESAVESVLAQSFEDFELLIIDDAGTDRSIELCRAYDDPRIRIISQANRGLAGARNTGIRQARGQFVALLDSDDLWEPEKLERHVEHLWRSPDVGVSYAASSMMDDDGNLLRIVQRPKLKGVTARDVFLRNPVGNGSAPVLRRVVFDDIAFINPQRDELDYFDESFRQSEDIECWCRIALMTPWRFEGITGAYTKYRINEGGLSANVVKQFETWSRVKARVAELAPAFAAEWSAHAEAYQKRYLARRCFRMGDGALAWSLMKEALQICPKILVEEPAKTLTTIVAVLALRFKPERANRALQALIERRSA
ncbi:MAG: glycosyltransferase family 2 protein [Hyphomonadaceae bacterium]|nr:glycosyltransferase family 2 protein [Hyphomonadaceae bacterium]